MSRDITPQATAAAAAQTVRTMYLALLDFASGPVRVTSAPYDVPYDLDGDGVAEVWTSTLGLGSLSVIEEGTETRAYDLQAGLNGLTPEAVSLALQEVYQGRRAWVWRCLLDEGHRIVPDPVLIFAGRMDTMPLEIGDKSELVLTIVNRLADWERPRGGRYTSAEQQRRCPGDMFFQFVPQAVDKELTWGKA